jgi:hypothetical protein
MAEDKSSKKELNEKRQKQKPVRYAMMAILMDEEPLAADEFARILAAHHEFIASGGGGGHWETLVTDGGTETGVVLGVYLGQDNPEASGEQAQLQHKRLEGLDLVGVELPYAGLCGVCCREQDLRRANLAGCLATDADFSGANFQDANLAGADLSRADLCGCDFRGASLRGTDLENANLSGADLRGARTEGARLKGALMDKVVR